MLLRILPLFFIAGVFAGNLEGYFLLGAAMRTKLSVAVGTVVAGVHVFHFSKDYLGLNTQTVYTYAISYKVLLERCSHLHPFTFNH